MGLPDPDMNAAPARRGPRRQGASRCPRTISSASIDKASGRRRRELRGNPLRGLRPRRRRADRRGADRQPQPHRDQRPHRLLQERRQSRRVGLGQPRLRADGPDRISGARPGDADKVLEAAIEAGAEDVESRRGRPRDLDRVDTLHEVAKALEAALGEAEARQARPGSPQTEVEVARRRRRRR